MAEKLYCLWPFFNEFKRFATTIKPIYKRSTMKSRNVICGGSGFQYDIQLADYIGCAPEGLCTEN